MVFDVDFSTSVDGDHFAFPEICNCEVENLTSEIFLCFFFWKCWVHPAHPKYIWLDGYIAYITYDISHLSAATDSTLHHDYLEFPD